MSIFTPFNWHYAGDQAPEHSHLRSVHYSPAGYDPLDPVTDQKVTGKQVEQQRLFAI
jgi:hypothetical protein